MAMGVQGHDGSSKEGYQSLGTGLFVYTTGLHCGKVYITGRLCTFNRIPSISLRACQSM